MSWTRPYEVFVEFCIAMWLFDIIFITVNRNKILHAKIDSTSSA
jgi:hypothetical protein